MTISTRPSLSTRTKAELTPFLERTLATGTLQCPSLTLSD